MFKNYIKKSIQPMRPYVPGEDMAGISVSPQDTLELGGMIAVNPLNENDIWYVGKDFFNTNYREHVETGGFECQYIDTSAEYVDMSSRN